MGLFDLTDIALERGMQGASLRQQLLSNNVANVNTPGFKRTDVDFSSQLATAMQSGSTSDVESMTFQPQTDSATSLRADGNNVDMDQEMANLSENAVEYQTMVAVAHARLQMLANVIGGR